MRKQTVRLEVDVLGLLRELVHASIRRLTRRRKKKKKKENDGTISNPLRVDDEELKIEPESESSSDDDDEEEEDTDGSSGDETDSDKGRRGRKRIDSDESEEEMEHAGKFNKRKRVQASKANDLFQVLVDAIWNNRKQLPGELVASKDKVLKEGGTSTHYGGLVFSFGDEDLKPIEKSEHEKELNELWELFDFAIESNNIGAYHNTEGQSEEVNVHEEEEPSTLCSKGIHRFVLDDQIGLTCQFCSFVGVEIRHILPSWATRFGEKSGINAYTDEGGSLNLNDLSAAIKDDGHPGSSSVLTGTVWDLIPGMNETLYQHQREAFEFMWRNLAGSIHLNELKSHIGSDGTGGCVISHAPGTGKTRLSIVFIQTYMKVFPDSRPVIVAPCGMLNTWKEEFKKWKVNILIHDLNASEYSGKEDETIIKFIGSKHKNMWMRLVKIFSWDNGNSILLVSYSLFKKLVHCYDKDSEGEMSKMSKILLEKSGLFVFDEGHIARNDKSITWRALERIKTSKRIILSGTPFQNNFEELYNTLCLVRPKFAEKINFRKSKLYQRRLEFISDKEDGRLPESIKGKGKFVSLTNRINDDTLEELKMIIQPFVHVHSCNILKSLPGLRECVIVLEPPLHQKVIIDKMKHILSCQSFEKEYKMSLASIHPSLVMAKLTEHEKSLVDMQLLEKLRWTPNEGVKTKFVIELIRLCEALKERVLVFCQHINPLDMIKEHLVKLFNWTEGKELLQMTGEMHATKRQPLIGVFNDSTSEAKVLLASTKACGEGISLIGASRVILLDVVWNPSVERQAISRAYRIGQGKVVYVYHLIASGTGEQEKYIRQVKKDHLSKLVFSPTSDINNSKAGPNQSEEGSVSKLVAEDKVLAEMTGHEKLKDMFIKVYYPSKESNIMHAFVEESENPVDPDHQ